MAELEPGYLGEILADVRERKRLGRGIALMEQRRGRFRSELEMLLAGAAMLPESRELVNERLTDYFSQLSGDKSFRLVTTEQDEIVVGGGFHAAVYCLNRVLQGYAPPVVLERGDPSQVGGCWAWSLNPVFDLNSRNRPDALGQGTPDQDGALNFIPGAPIQPAMMSSEEYCDNACMAWLVRVILALSARVRPGVTVTEVRPSDTTVVLSTGQVLKAGRILDARGLGDPKDAALADNKSVFTFPQWMARMGGDFPLRGITQVAIIGGGNSGACAAESALGIGPGHMSVAGLDWVRAVDWYTGGAIQTATCDSIRSFSRGRYIRLAQQTEGNVSNRFTRLRLLGSRATPAPLNQGVFVAGRTYDAAVLCTGFELPEIYENPSRFVASGGGLPLAANLGNCWKIGPAANLGFSPVEPQVVTAEAPNRVAMFRLAPRTAALARKLKGLS